MGEQAAKADDCDPVEEVCGRNCDITVVARANDAENALDHGEPEQDRHGGLGFAQVFGADGGEGEHQCAGGGCEGGKGDRCAFGAGNDKDADEAKCEGEDAGAGHDFAKEERCEDGDPKRVGEFKREKLRKWDVDEGVEPKVLAREVKDVADGMQPEAVGRNFAAFAINRGDTKHDNHADKRAVHHDFKGIERARQFAPCHGHCGEGHHCADHEKGRFEGLGLLFDHGAFILVGCGNSL